MTKDFIDLRDLSGDEIRRFIELIGVMKEAHREREVPDLLKKRTLAMVFLGSSLRTRISFEGAMTALGGHAIYVRPGDIHLGKKESLEDTARVLGRLSDGIMIRAPEYKDIEGVARYARVAVINGMADDKNHPTQALNDFFTMFERSGSLDGVSLTFVGDTSDGFGVMGRDLMRLASKVGVDFYCASPTEYMAEDSYLKMIRENAEAVGSEFVMAVEPDEVVGRGDYITCDAFTWYGFEEETEKRLAVFMPKYQVNRAMIDKTKDSCLFLHCLPANRGEEVTSDVVDGDRSIVFDQAENRLYTQLALCAVYLSDERDLARTAAEGGRYADRILSLVRAIKG